MKTYKSGHGSHAYVRFYYHQNELKHLTTLFTYLFMYFGENSTKAFSFFLNNKFKNLWNDAVVNCIILGKDRRKCQCVKNFNQNQKNSLLIK